MSNLRLNAAICSALVFESFEIRGNLLVTCAENDCGIKLVLLGEVLSLVDSLLFAEALESLLRLDSIPFSLDILNCLLMLLLTFLLSFRP